MRIEIGQVISQIISFLIMLWVLTKFGWKPLLKILTDRQEKIKAEFETITAQKQDLFNLQTEYQNKLQDIDSQAQVAIQKALIEARKVALEIENKAQIEAKNMITKAQEDFKIEIDKAKTELKNELVHLIFMTTQKMMQENLNPEKQNRLILDFINKVELH